MKKNDALFHVEIVGLNQILDPDKLPELEKFITNNLENDANKLNDSSEPKIGITLSLIDTTQINGLASSSVVVRIYYGNSQLNTKTLELMAKFINDLNEKGGKKTTFVLTILTIQCETIFMNYHT